MTLRLAFSLKSRINLLLHTQLSCDMRSPPDGKLNQKEHSMKVFITFLDDFFALNALTAFHADVASVYETIFC